MSVTSELQQAYAQLQAAREAEFQGLVEAAVSGEPFDTAEAVVILDRLGKTPEAFDDAVERSTEKRHQAAEAAAMPERQAHRREVQAEVSAAEAEFRDFLKAHEIKMGVLNPKLAAAQGAEQRSLRALEWLQANYRGPLRGESAALDAERDEIRKSLDSFKQQRNAARAYCDDHGLLRPITRTKDVEICRQRVADAERGIEAAEQRLAEIQQRQAEIVQLMMRG